MDPTQVKLDAVQHAPIDAKAVATLFEICAEILGRVIALEETRAQAIAALLKKPDEEQ